MSSRRGHAPARPRMSPDAAVIQQRAFDHAIRLGHSHLGGEHILLSLASAPHPAGAALRAYGVTPDRVEEQIVRLSGGGLFSDLDRDALGSLGIDVETVCDRVTRALGPEALHRASRATFQEHRVRWWNPRRRAGALQDGVFLPIRPGTGTIQCAKHARAEAEARHDPQVRVEHLALGLLSVTDGLVPAVFAALEVCVPDLRAALAA